MYLQGSSDTQLLDPDSPLQQMQYHHCVPTASFALLPTEAVYLATRAGMFSAALGLLLATAAAAGA